MNKVLSKTMRASESTLNRLDSLKSEVQKHYPEEYISNDLIVNFLLDFKQNIKKNYVEREHFNEIFSLKDNQKKRIENLEEQLSNIDNSYQKNIGSLKDTILKQGDVVEGYKNSISEKENQIKTLEADIRNISKDLDSTNKILSEITTENKFLHSENKNLSSSITQDYFRIYDLRCMVDIIKFLRNPVNRFRWFSAKQIYKKLKGYWGFQEVKNCLDIASYRCFPVRVGRSDRGLIFRYQKI